MDRGYYTTVYRVKQDVVQIDNITKFGYEPEDYEYVQEWVEYTDEEFKQKSIEEAKNGLNSTDYIAAKTLDALLSCSDSNDILNVLTSFKTEYGDIIEQRKQWRKQINDLE